MDNNRILNLPFPQTPGEPVTKAFAEMHYYDYLNILTFEGTMTTHTITHIDDMVDTPFNGHSNQILDFSKVGSSYQINFSVSPKLPKGIYGYEMDIVLTSSVGYNISLWGELDEDYQRQELDEVNEKVTGVLITKLSELMVNLDLVKDNVPLEDDLAKNELFKRDVKRIIGYLTPHVPMVG